MKFLADNSFRVYRTFQLPRFSEAHQSRVASLVQNYLYIRYTSTTSDLIPRFRSAEDVQVKVHADEFTQGPLVVSYVTIVHQQSTQYVVFVKRADEHLVLVKSPSPLFLVQTIESLDFDPPLALQAISFSPEKMVHLFNLTGEKSISEMGSLQFVFSPPQPLSADSLREIVVDVPAKDAKLILAGKSPMEGIYEWLENSTTVKFANLRVKSLRCEVFGFEGDKVRLSGSEEVLQRTTEMLMDVIRNE